LTIRPDDPTALFLWWNDDENSVRSGHLPRAGRLVMLTTLIKDEDDYNARLDALIAKHQMSGAARADIDMFCNLVRTMGALGLIQAQGKLQEDWSERFHRVSDTLGNYTVPFLRKALNSVNGGSKGRMWNGANSDELLHAADRIITGNDEALKAKLISVCRS
jgi:hypothetical protein